MSQYKLNIGLNHPYGGLKNRSNAYQVRNDVPAPIGRMQQENNYNQNQQLLLEEQQRQEKERENMQMFEDKEKEEEEIRQRQIQEAITEEARIDEMDTLVEKNINAQSKIRQQKTIKDVIEISTRHADANVDLDWLLIDEQNSKYYKVGKFIGKHDFTPSGFEGLGLYLPREDYNTFYNDSRILVFYEFEKAVFSDGDLVGKIFKTNEQPNYPSNFQLSKIPTSTRTRDLNNKKEYVRDAKQFMRTAIKRYLNIPNFSNENDRVYFETIIEFYEQIVPMVQRSLEQNPNYNGNITMAIAQLDSLEEKVKKSIPNFTDEKYITGEYIETIRKLLSPVSAEIRPPASATVIPTAAASAAPESVFSSLGNYVPSFLGNAASGTASYLGNAASGTASYLGNSAANVLRFGTGFPQDAKGMMFAKSQALRYTPPVAKLSPADDDMAVSNVYDDLKLRRGERADYYGDPTKYHGPYDYTYKLDNDLNDTAKQIVGERKAAADANKMSLYGGKRKSKRKPRRSQKQKKSRKQRR